MKKTKFLNPFKGGVMLDENGKEIKAEENKAEVKTPEELLAEKKAAFEANPDEFLHISELIVAARRTDQGFGYLVNPDRVHPNAGRKELHIAMGELAYRVANYFVRVDMENAMKKKKTGIVKPGNNGGALGFLHKKMGRRRR